MITRSEHDRSRQRAAEMIRGAGFALTDQEAAAVEVADFGLGRLETEGAQIATLVSTERLGAKVLALFPHQALPEHWHPRVGDDPGKEETIRLVWGEASAFVPGESTRVRADIPSGKEICYTVRHGVALGPGDQITLEPGTRHWLQAGERGAVLFSFSTVARDVLDCFADPGIERTTRIQD